MQVSRACKNCTYILDEAQEYCGQCGARFIDNRFSFAYLFQELSDRYLGTDNVLFRTISHLLYQPEKVVNGYLLGLRKRYTNVINFFAIALTLLGIEMFIIKKFFADAMLKPMEQFNDANAEKMGFDPTSMMQHMMEYQSLYLMLSIPVLALVSYLVMITHKSKLNYTEHLIIVLYYTSLYSIISAFTTTLVLWLLPDFSVQYSMLLYLALLGYGIFYYARIFNLSAKGVIGRTALFFAVMLVLYLISVFVALTVMISTGILKAPPPS